MFRRNTAAQQTDATAPIERITSVLGPGINWKGNLRGNGGIRIEGSFEGEITIRGMVVVGETGRVQTKNLCSNTVIVAGTVNGNITAERLDIRSTGRVWGDVTVSAFTTEEGAFLRGQVRMEERIELEQAFGEETPPQEKPGLEEVESEVTAQEDL
jgi:cytoskeletal protein CcmA (bactofilin family)